MISLDRNWGPVLVESIYLQIRHLYLLTVGLEKKRSFNELW